MLYKNIVISIHTIVKTPTYDNKYPFCSAGSLKVSMANTENMLWNTPIGNPVKTTGHKYN